MKHFLSCDWGTSSFRLRYVDMSSFTFKLVESSNHGIAKIHALWKQSGKKEEERFSFYLHVIRDHIKMLEDELRFSIKEIPLIISGMASSTIGMINLPYRDIPFLANGSDLEIKKISAAADFEHDLFIISGVRSNNDVMRGEETQLAGCVQQIEEGLFIFPGTHSKHIKVENGRVVDFKTYMTGEFFDLLSQKSILAGSVENASSITSGGNKEAFLKGVVDSNESNLLHSAFLVRTNELFGKYSPGANYYYLSGLLIRAELKDAIDSANKNIVLVASGILEDLYSLALYQLNKKGIAISVESAETALIRGQFAILKDSL